MGWISYFLIETEGFNEEVEPGLRFGGNDQGFASLVDLQKMTIRFIFTISEGCRKKLQEKAKKCSELKYYRELIAN